MIETDRLVSGKPAAAPDEASVEQRLRPARLADYVGQNRCASRWRFSFPRRASAARRSTMCCCSVRPDSARPRSRTSSPMKWARPCARPPAVLERAGDLAALLTNLQPNDVLFIDEIHRSVRWSRKSSIRHWRLSDRHSHRRGPAARSIKLDLPPFTLIGATTRAGCSLTAARSLRHCATP